MSVEQKISVSDLRREFPDIISRIQLLQQSFLVMKNGKPFARLSPLTEGGHREEVRTKLANDSGELEPAEEVLGAESTS